MASKEQKTNMINLESQIQQMQSSILTLQEVINTQSKHMEELLKQQQSIVGGESDALPEQKEQKDVTLTELAGLQRRCPLNSPSNRRRRSVV